MSAFSKIGLVYTHYKVGDKAHIVSNKTGISHSYIGQTCVIKDCSDMNKMPPYVQVTTSSKSIFYIYCSDLRPFKNLNSFREFRKSIALANEAKV